MGEFIHVNIDIKNCVGMEECGQCVRVCPVNIFDQGNEKPVIVPANEDECTLCDLCLRACAPGAIAVIKNYE